MARAERPTAPGDVNTSRRLSYFFLEAVRYQQKGDYAAAYDLLQHCRDIDPDAAEVYFALAPYYAAVDNDSMAFVCMSRAAGLRPDNTTYIERLAETCVNMRRYDEAVAAYEKLYTANHERTDVLNILLQLYSQDNDLDNMLRTIDRIETEEGTNDRIALARMRVYSLQGRKDKELEELEHLCATNPDNLNYRVMKGNWLLQDGRTERAYTEYKEVLDEDPDNLQALMSMLDYYNVTGNDSLLNALKERILISDETPMKTKVTLMVKYVNENRTDSATVNDLFRRILARPQKTGEMYELYYAYLTLVRAPKDDIETVLLKALEVEPDNASLRLHAIQLRWEESDYDGTIALCLPAMEFNPDEMVFYYFYGFAYYMQGDRDRALEAFQLGVSQINDKSNADIVSDFYSIMGDILYTKNRRDEAFAAYDSSLQWKPDNISCLNNYAYYLCLAGIDLKKAERMSLKTVKAEPTSTTYLDTYAWILFRQGRYGEAQQFIDQALSNDTSATGQAIILEHAGDIYAMCGDTERALDYWQQAVDLGGESAVLTRKLRLKRYVDEE